MRGRGRGGASRAAMKAFERVALRLKVRRSASTSSARASALSSTNSFTERCVQLQLAGRSSFSGRVARNAIKLPRFIPAFLRINRRTRLVAACPETRLVAACPVHKYFRYWFQGDRYLFTNGRGISVACERWLKFGWRSNLRSCRRSVPKRQAAQRSLRRSTSSSSCGSGWGGSRTRSRRKCCGRQLSGAF
jgi:hypothetical protein